MRSKSRGSVARVNETRKIALRRAGAPCRALAQAFRTRKWFAEHFFLLVPAQAIVAQHIQTFQEFPPRQRPGRFSIDQALEKLTDQKGSN
jgi:hypothetical protein